MRLPVFASPVYDLQGHAADAVRDACLRVLGTVVSFNDSAAMADRILDHLAGEQARNQAKEDEA